MHLLCCDSLETLVHHKQSYSMFFYCGSSNVYFVSADRFSFSFLELQNVQFPPELIDHHAATTIISVMITKEYRVVQLPVLRISTGNRCFWKLGSFRFFILQPQRKCAWQRSLHLLHQGTAAVWLWCQLNLINLIKSEYDTMFKDTKSQEEQESTET